VDRLDLCTNTQLYVQTHNSMYIGQIYAGHPTNSHMKFTKENVKKE